MAHAEQEPEDVFARLVSGDPESLLRTQVTLEQLTRAVDELAETMTTALHRTEWHGGRGARAFRKRGEAAFVRCAEAAWRLDRGAEAVRRVERSYHTFAEAAVAAMADWRNPAVPRSERLRHRTLRDLTTVVAEHDHRIMDAQRILTRSGEKLEEWFERGAVKDYRLALRTGAGRGVRIPDSLLNGDGGGWTQQGLGYDPTAGQFLVSSYRGDENQLTFVDRGTGAESRSVHLGAAGDLADGIPGPKHVGGVQVVGEDVFVVSTEQGGQSFLYRYSLAALQGAGNGDVVPAEAKLGVPASSYLAADGDRLLLGSTDPAALYACPLAAATGGVSGPLDGTPFTDVPVPAHANGVVASGAGYTFAIGSDRGKSTAALQHFDRDGNPVHTTPVGNMAEEVELVDGQFVGLSEAGAEKFSPFDDKTKHPGRLWGQTNLYELDADEVTGRGGTPGFEVQPESLRSTSVRFGEVQDGLGGLRRTLDATTVSSSWIGGAPHAGRFAAIARAYLDDLDRPLRSGARRAERIADGLLDAATRFEEAEQSSAERSATMRSHVD